jgi:hypothetical protein
MATTIYILSAIIIVLAIVALPGKKHDKNHV